MIWSPIFQFRYYMRRNYWYIHSLSEFFKKFIGVLFEFFIKITAYDGIFYINP